MSDLFHPGEYLQDELEARGWSTADCAARMGGDDPKVDQLALDILLTAAAAPEGHAIERMHIGEYIALGLAKAFAGQNAETWLNLDREYHRRREERDRRKERRHD